MKRMTTCSRLLRDTINHGRRVPDSWVALARDKKGVDSNPTHTEFNGKGCSYMFFFSV